MGPGAIPTSTPAKTLAVAEAFGEGSHVLVPTELPSSINVTANLAGWRANLETDAPQWLAPRYPSGGPGITDPASADANMTLEITDANVAHQNVPPVLGCYVIKWSITRKYYVVP